MDIEAIKTAHVETNVLEQPDAEFYIVCGDDLMAVASRKWLGVFTK